MVINTIIASEYIFLILQMYAKIPIYRSDFTAKIVIIFLLAFTFGGFVVHQPLVIILRLLDAEIAGHGVHGDERLIQPFIQASESLTQGYVLLDNDCRGLRLRQYCGSSNRAAHITLTEPIVLLRCA